MELKLCKLVILTRISKRNINIYIRYTIVACTHVHKKPVVIKYFDQILS